MQHIYPKNLDYYYKRATVQNIMLYIGFATYTMNNKLARITLPFGLMKTWLQPRLFVSFA
jgi:hypothetical protein